MDNVAAISLIDEMTADLYINKVDQTVNVLHSEPFDAELIEAEYDFDQGVLLFKFSDKVQEFGQLLLGEFKEFLADVTHITLLQINMDTKQTVAGQEIPLKLKF